MASISDFKYRIRHDEKLSEEEKELIIEGVTEDSIQERIKMRREILAKKLTFICKQCDKTFEPVLTKRFVSKELCSDACSTKYYNNLRKKPAVEQICPICGIKHTPHKGTKCPNCRHLYIKTCACGREFKGSSNRKLCDFCVTNRSAPKEKVVTVKEIKPRKPRVKRPSKRDLIYLEYQKLKAMLIESSNMSETIRISIDISNMEKEHGNLINKVEKEYGIK